VVDDVVDSKHQQKLAGRRNSQQRGWQLMAVGLLGLVAAAVCGGVGQQPWRVMAVEDNVSATMMMSANDCTVGWHLGAAAAGGGIVRRLGEGQ
jgi:hypothetical protein